MASRRAPAAAREVRHGGGLDRGDVAETIQSTGQVQPLLQVQVGAAGLGAGHQGVRRLQQPGEGGRPPRRDRPDPLRRRHRPEPRRARQAKAAVAHAEAAARSRRSRRSTARRSSWTRASARRPDSRRAQGTLRRRRRRPRLGQGERLAERRRAQVVADQPRRTRASTRRSTAW